MFDTIHLICPHCDRINRLPAARLAAGPRCGVCKGEIIGGSPPALDDTSFERWITRNELPVVVDFWAEWCGPCKMMAPHFAKAAERFAGRALFAKLETDRAPQTAARFSIRSIPTVIVFAGGRELARQAGAVDSARLTAFVEAALAGPTSRSQ